MKKVLHIGIDVGSTTVKMVVMDKDYQVYYGENNKRVTKYIRKFNFNKGDIIIYWG